MSITLLTGGALKQHLGDTSAEQALLNSVHVREYQPAVHRVSLRVTSSYLLLSTHSSNRAEKALPFFFLQNFAVVYIDEAH